MKEEWTETCLDELVRIEHGFAFSGEHIVDTPHPDALITPGNFAIGGGWQEKKIKYYSGPIPERYVLQPGDLVVTMTDLSKTGDTLGYAAVVPDDLRYRLLHNQRIGLIRVQNDRKATPAFLHWLMRSPDYRAEILASATGSTVRHTSPARIGAFRFQLPPLDEQRRIAALLGVLEDKIELNRKLNRTLEEMAQALFKSWFIDFDGHENFEDSELGPIPKGWSAGSFAEVACPHRHAIDPSTVPPDFPYIGLADMPENSISLADWGAAETADSGKLLFEHGDILFGRLRPYFKKVGIAPVDGLCSSDIIVVRPSAPEYWGVVLGVLTLDSFIAHATASSTGTRMPRVSWKDMGRFAIAVPPAPVAAEYTGIIRPLIDKIVANNEQSRTLAQLRDLLLPKLISGELRVPESLP